MQIVAVAEGKSWEYTLGRIDERTEQTGQRLDRVGQRLGQVEEKMLTKGTFLAMLAVVTALLATLITLN